MTLTPTRQRNSVSEGMALGLVVLGHPDLPFNKATADLAFTGAWRSWIYTSRFPQVQTDLSHGSDGVRVMTRADEAKKTWVLFWDAGRRLTIYPRQDDWDPADPEDISYALDMLDGDVPLAGWTDLAQAFLDRYLPYVGSRGA